MSSNGNTKKRILILGGGFGGAYAALELEKTFASASDVEVLLIAKNNFLLFTPMLHEVAASDVDITHIVSPLRGMLRKTSFLQGDVTAIDLENKIVRVAHCSSSELNELRYDYLLLALGPTPNFFNIPGMQEKAYTMSSLSDAVKLRNALIGSLEEAEFDAFTGSQKPLLTYVVVGGGFAGVETVAALNDFVRDSLKEYKHLTEDMVRVVLVHEQPHILPELGPGLGDYACKKLAMRGVEMKLQTKVTGFSRRGVEFNNGDYVRPVICVWTAGVSANPIMRTLSAKNERGKIVVNEFMEVPDWPDVWAIGDCAWIPDTATGRNFPPTAQHACREGKVVARNIVHTIRKTGQKEKFKFKTIGQLAAIGRRAGVAKVFGFKFSGVIAWWLWRSVYLMKLPGLERQIRVAFDWTLSFLFPTAHVQFADVDEPLIQNLDDQGYTTPPVSSEIFDQVASVQPSADASHASSSSNQKTGGGSASDLAVDPTVHPNLVPTPIEDGKSSEPSKAGGSDHPSDEEKVLV